MRVMYFGIYDAIQFKPNFKNTKLCWNTQKSFYQKSVSAGNFSKKS